MCCADGMGFPNADSVQWERAQPELVSQAPLTRQRRAGLPLLLVLLANQVMQRCLLRHRYRAMRIWFECCFFFRISKPMRHRYGVCVNRSALNVAWCSRRMPHQHGYKCRCYACHREARKCVLVATVARSDEILWSVFLRKIFHNSCRVPISNLVRVKMPLKVRP